MESESEWLITFSLSNDGRVTKKYELLGAEPLQVEISLDKKGELHAPDFEEQGITFGAMRVPVL